MGRRLEAATGVVGGAFGAGVVLVVMPSLAIYYGIEKIAANSVVGLPILAIFGIMILFGALALISTLFARLRMQDRRQAMGLPEGSIRAAIALSLIVLFAIISIMLYQAVARTHVLPSLDRERKDLFLSIPANDRNVIAVMPVCLDKDASPCPVEQQRFDIHLRQPAGQESADLAKQLLILIGTLMTSVTSFYFASRALEPKRDKEQMHADRSELEDASVDRQPGDFVADARETTPVMESHVDGCDVAIADADATADEQLPAAKGGVA